MNTNEALHKFIRKNLKLNKEEAENETYNEIVEACEFSGFNLWILGFAMLIACIGLNTNSASAIIGAMLISPLMGPMVGYAFALSINDTKLKYAAIRNWIWMTLISLLASILFFIISPFHNNTDVLLSFTNASLFDVLIAFFGGMAGFIGLMKRDGVKVMAGVAVATACMPPLCAAGFSIVQGNWMQALGALYFYGINCLFIGLATFITSRLTGFHTYFKTSKNKNKLTHGLWILFIAAMIVPSIYIIIQKWKEQKNPQKITISDKQRIENLEKKVYELDSLLQLKSQ